MQVDNQVSVTHGSLNTIRTVTPQNVFSHTKPTTQLGVNNKSLPSTKGSGGTMHPPFGIGVNRGQQIPQLVMRSPSPPDLGKESQVSNAQAQYTSNVAKIEEFLVKEKLIIFSQEKRSLKEKSTVSITTLVIIVLMLVGVSRILSGIGSIREY